MFKNISLSKYTFTHTGGSAKYLVLPKSIHELEKDLNFAHKRHLPILTLGNASNMIISDKGFNGLVIILTNLHNITIHHNLITVDAGFSMIDLSIFAQKHSLSGLEYCAGLPGTVGGAIFMNASAYNGNTGEVIKSVKVMCSNGTIKTLTHSQLNFSYRYSYLQSHTNLIVLQATFKLKSANQNYIQSLMDNFNAQRMAKQPLLYPSCGSVFRRPKGHYVGQLVHDAHLQGYHYGGAKVSNTHAGFIININHATANDYLHVIHHIQHVVFKKFNVKLHTEVRIIR